YDPTTGTWSLTGNLNVARDVHTSTLLPSGLVLAAGGGGGGIYALSSAELYDWTTGTWTLTGSLNDGRGLHTATLLSNGMVLAAGGEDLGDLSSTELYEPRAVVATQLDGRGTNEKQGNEVTFEFRAGQTQNG